MEIERKFLVRMLPEGLERHPCKHIEQAYLCLEPALRVRREEPMAAHTTFRIGGPARRWAEPSGAAEGSRTTR